MSAHKAFLLLACLALTALVFSGCAPRSYYGSEQLRQAVDKQLRAQAEDLIQDLVSGGRGGSGSSSSAKAASSYVVGGQRYYVLADATGFVQQGQASWYGGKFHGRKTSSGEIFDQNKMTAAHKNLPFGTVVEVRNLNNGRTVRVRINDRGPFSEDRIIDLSRAAALKLGFKGVAPVRIEAVN